MTFHNFRVFDNRGRELQVGDEVAYNLSGELAAGIIAKITLGSRYGRPTPIIDIRLLHNAAGFYSGHISRVRDPKCCLVIK